MGHLDLLILGYYLGLVILALNGIVYLGLRQKKIELKAMEEHLMRLLIKVKLKGRR